MSNYLRKTAWETNLHDSAYSEAADRFKEWFKSDENYKQFNLSELERVCSIPPKALYKDLKQGQFMLQAYWIRLMLHFEWYCNSLSKIIYNY